MSKPRFEIETKGVCFLCLNSTCRFYDDNSDLPTSTSFKSFLRYLKVDLGMMTVGASGATPNQAFESVNLSVYLCDDCSPKINDFLQAYLAYENIRQQLVTLVGQLHSFMEKGDRDPDRVREFETRINAGQMQNVNGSVIVDRLRKEALEKAGQRVPSSASAIPLNDFLETSLDIEENYEIVSRTIKAENISPAASHSSDYADLLDLDEEQAEMNCDANATTDEYYSEEDESMDMDLSNEITIQNVCSMNQIHGDGLEDLADADVQAGPGSSVAVLATDFDKYNKSNGMGHVKPGNRRKQPGTSNQLKCRYCGYNYSNQSNLTTHQYVKHASDLLSDKGLLPPGFCEDQMETSVAAILGEWDSSQRYKCPYCTRTGLPNKYYARIHLLRKHAEQVFGEATTIQVARKGPFSGKRRTTPRKCVFHLPTSHGVTYLSGQGRLPPGQLEKSVANMNMLVGQGKGRGRVGPMSIV